MSRRVTNGTVGADPATAACAGQPGAVSMATITTSSVGHRRVTVRALKAIILGGLIAGTVDIGAAALISGADPSVVQQFIAGGLLGPAALQGGAWTMWLGLFLQWGMSMLIAAIFVLAALRVRWLTARWLVAGLAYGVIVFVVMNYAVMPLSAWHRINHFKPLSFAGNLAAMLVFGLIVSICARRFLGRKRA
jgi:uncharacterized membrane protein YagU involved in acid resistance